MKALSLLYKESMAMPRIIKGKTVTAADIDKYLKTTKKVKTPADTNFSMRRVMNGVRWGGLGLGIAGAGYVASQG